MVGLPKEDADRFYKECIKASKLIIESGQYTLYRKQNDKTLNYQNLFIEKGMHEEAIFVKSYQTPNK